MFIVDLHVCNHLQHTVQTISILSVRVRVIVISWPWIRQEIQRPSKAVMMCSALSSQRRECAFSFFCLWWAKVMIEVFLQRYYFSGRKTAVEKSFQVCVCVGRRYWPEKKLCLMCERFFFFITAPSRGQNTSFTIVQYSGLFEASIYVHFVYDFRLEFVSFV